MKPHAWPVVMIALLATMPAARAIWVGDTTAPYVAQATLNFSLNVDKFLYLQVGSAGAQIDTVRFDLGTSLPGSGITSIAPPFSLGTGTPINAVTSGTLQVIVRGNNGVISVAATNNGAGLGLSNGSGAYLNYAQITTATDNAGLPAPALTNTGSTTVNVSATAYGGKVTNQTANWTFRLANTVVPAPGSYAGQVTYTAAMP